MTSLLNDIKKNNTIVFLFIITIAIAVSTYFMNDKGVSKIEGYSNYSLANNHSPGIYSKSSNDYDLLLKDSYDFTGRKTVNKNNYNDIWWNYPVFGVGSYSQITNNLRYRKNPDDGVCITADFCGALYKDKHLASNVAKPLPPAPEMKPGSKRINYFLTEHNLLPGPSLGPELQAF